MNRRGFSLIELVIALFVSSAVFAAVLPLILSSITANRLVKLRTAAYEHAQKEIEATKNQSLSAITNHSFTVSGIPGASGIFTITRPNTDLAELSSRVTWTFKGKQENVELKTYKYEATE